MNKKNINKYMNINSNNIKNTLMIIGDISDTDWWEEDVTPSKILNSLEELGNISELEVFVNSYGGSVQAGLAISHILDGYKKENSVKLVGIVSMACSIATTILMPCDVIKMHRNALFMIHPASSSTYGNAEEMRESADVLDIITNSLIDGYMTRFKGERSELEKLVNKESWLSAEEALRYGFVDEIIEPLEMVASGKGIKVNNVLFERKEIVDILKTKIENKVGSEESMKYDKVLMDYGISEETFNAFESVSDLMTIVRAKNDAEKEVEIQEAVEEVKAGIVITKEDVKSKLESEEITADEIIDLAIIGKNVDAKMQEKLAKYENVVKERDLMRADVVKSTLESGRRAMGIENFSNSVWEKALNTMNYEDVKVMKNDWDRKAKDSLNAGSRKSVVQPSYKNAISGNKNYNV